MRITRIEKGRRRRIGRRREGKGREGTRIEKGRGRMIGRRRERRRRKERG